MTRLMDEIIRHQTVYSWALHVIASCSGPNGWKAEKAMSWLMDHPINCKVDMVIDNDSKFVIQEMEKKKFLLEEYLTNKAE